MKRARVYWVIDGQRVYISERGVTEFSKRRAERIAWKSTSPFRSCYIELL